MRNSKLLWEVGLSGLDSLFLALPQVAFYRVHDLGPQRPDPRAERIRII
jgi:hypothetical protein